MKAHDFQYARPDSLEAALALLADEARDAVPLSGGQSLVPMMNFRMSAPELLVDLAAVPGLSGIARDGDAIVIGAMTRTARLIDDPVIAEHLPLLARAAADIAHAAIRNRGTVGGSVALADPAAELPACLLVLGAEVELAAPQGRRRVAADDFFLGLYETAREPAEIVTAIRIPVPPRGSAWAFHEIARRHGDYAMAGVALAAAAAAPLSDPRIAFFGVADRAVRVPAAEAALDGHAPGDAAARAAAIAVLDGIDYLDDLNASATTKRHYAGVVLTRALDGIASHE